VSESIDIPQLRDPWMVAAFEGWNDAADAASGTVDHLIEEWDAELLIELDLPRTTTTSRSTARTSASTRTTNAS